MIRRFRSWDSFRLVADTPVLQSWIGSQKVLPDNIAVNHYPATTGLASKRMFGAVLDSVGSPYSRRPDALNYSAALAIFRPDELSGS